MAGNGGVIGMLVAWGVFALSAAVIVHAETSFLVVFGYGLGLWLLFR